MVRHVEGFSIGGRGRTVQTSVVPRNDSIPVRKKMKEVSPGMKGAAEAIRQDDRGATTYGLVPEGNP